MRVSVQARPSASAVEQGGWGDLHVLEVVMMIAIAEAVALVGLSYFYTRIP